MGNTRDLFKKIGDTKGTFHAKMDSIKDKNCMDLIPPSIRIFSNESTFHMRWPKYWSGLPFPSPGNLPHPGIKPESPALQADALPSEPPGKH